MGWISALAGRGSIQACWGAFSPQTFTIPRCGFLVLFCASGKAGNDFYLLTKGGYQSSTSKKTDTKPARSAKSDIFSQLTIEILLAGGRILSFMDWSNWCHGHESTPCAWNGFALLSLLIRSVWSTIHQRIEFSISFLLSIDTSLALAISQPCAKI